MKVLKKLLVILLILLIIAISGIYGLFYMATNENHRPYMDLIEKYSQQYDLEKELVTAIIKVESNFSKEAVSHADAEGLMQLIPESSKWIAGLLGEEYDYERLFDPQTNIRYGTYLLRYLINYYNSVDYAIIAYNAGHGNVDNWIGSGILSGKTEDYENIPFPEAKNYIKKVKDQYHLNKKIYDVYYKDKESSRAMVAFKTMMTLFSKSFFK